MLGQSGDIFLVVLLACKKIEFFSKNGKNYRMSYDFSQLKELGFQVIEDVLADSEIEIGKKMFFDWHNIQNIGKLPHGIFKHHQVGHTAFAWYTRTRPKVIDVFRQLWKQDDLIVSFDGSCYISPDEKRRDTWWYHTDQAPNNSEFCCVQGFVAFTDNETTTLKVMPGTNLEHANYMKSRGITHSKNWQKIDQDVNFTEKVVSVKRGSLILWDSRTFHQNQYGNGEERLVQYVCYLPRSRANKSNLQKRSVYFQERRTTSHWPTPVRVNGLQPQVYGDSSKLIDYTLLQDHPDNIQFLQDHQNEIQSLV
jgi:hypothetical protein